MNVGWLYFMVIIFIALPLSLFEAWMITHYRVGWGEPLPKDKWWAKPLMKKAPFNLVGIVMLTRYHFGMFFVAVPVSVFVSGILLGSFIKHSLHGWFEWIIFVTAGTIGVMVLEDFLFFVVSSIIGKPYPRALVRLLRGEATWHPNQIDFRFFKLPVPYVLVPVIVFMLLLIMKKFASY